MRGAQAKVLHTLGLLGLEVWYAKISSANQWKAPYCIAL